MRMAGGLCGIVNIGKPEAPRRESVSHVLCTRSMAWVERHGYVANTSTFAAKSCHVKVRQRSCLARWEVNKIPGIEKESSPVILEEKKNKKENTVVVCSPVV